MIYSIVTPYIAHYMTYSIVTSYTGSYMTYSIVTSYIGSYMTYSIVTSYIGHFLSLLYTVDGNGAPLLGEQLYGSKLLCRKVQNDSPF